MEDFNSAFDGKKGIPGVVKKVVIVIVMFGVSSYIFSVAREMIWPEQIVEDDWWYCPCL